MWRRLLLDDDALRMKQASGRKETRGEGGEQGLPLTSCIPPRPDPEVLREVVSFLCTRMPHRNGEHPKVLDDCARYVQSCFQSCSQRTGFQEFSVGGHSYRNVTCSFGERQAPRIVVGAHYDVFGEQPGADDNASGVAGLVALARLLADFPPDEGRRIDLVAYPLEEPPYFRTGCMGSAVHARDLAVRRVPVKAMLCLEMIGYYSENQGSQSYPLPFMKLRYPDRANFIAVVGRLGQNNLAKRVAVLMTPACAVDIQHLSAPSVLPGIDLSDHLNYWACGYPAVMITDTAFFRNPHYHQPSDRPETLDYEAMSEVSRGVWRAVLNL